MVKETHQSNQIYWQPVSGHYSTSVHPENIRKTCYLIFSGVKKWNINMKSVNSFLQNVPFGSPFPLKTSENQRFSDVFKGSKGNIRKKRVKVNQSSRGLNVILKLYVLLSRNCSFTLQSSVYQPKTQWCTLIWLTFIKLHSHFNCYLYIRILVAYLLSEILKFWSWNNKSKNRSSRLEVFCEKGVPKNIGNFAGKHMCQSLVLIKLHICSLTIYQKRLRQRCLPSILRYFFRALFLFIEQPSETSF